MAEVDYSVKAFCELIPVAGDHSKIELTDAEPVVIGRGPLTKITDQKCSKQQVEVCADFSKQELHVKQLGYRSSRVANKCLKRNETFLLGPMGVLELLEGKYKYHVYFGKKSLIPSEVDGTCARKRKMISTDESEMTVDVSQSKASDLQMPHQSESGPPHKKLKVGSHPVQTTLCLPGGKPAGASASVHDLELKAWNETDSMLIYQQGQPFHSAKVAAFDVDSTIIETASGKKFATGPTDWKLMSRVASTLISLAGEGFRVVLITNQLGIGKGKPTKDDYKKKMEAVATQLGIPLLLMASLTKDICRKPCTGMWDHLLQHENRGVEVDMKVSFYVGDAAGRESGWMPGRKKDFSCADRKFAANIDITFLTPEEIFLKHPSCKKYNWGEFNPTTLDYSNKKENSVKIPTSSQELVVFVGCPASGKSKFYRDYMEQKGYCHVNRDNLGSWTKCVAKCTEYLKSGKHVVVDNTNPDRASRSRYIQVGVKFKVPVRCFQFVTSVVHAKHNNRFRELTQTEGVKHAVVNDMIFNIFKSKFVEPQCEEGFSEVAKIEFIPTFSDGKLETLYHQFLI